jgi:hypothetical protein
MLVSKWRSGSKIKTGLNWGVKNKDIEVAFKIPLWLEFKEKYRDFDTKCVMSGFFIRCLCWYVRRRNNELVREGLNRWVVDCPTIVSIKFGHQTLIRGTGT